MKKFSYCPIIGGLLFVLSLLSCKKQSDQLAAPVPPAAAPDSVLIKQINAWMDLETQVHEEPERKATIQRVKQSLDFSRMQVEEYKEGMKFILVPLRSSFVSNTNKEIRPENTVLFRTDAGGEIGKGNIVQYIPENISSGTKLPAGLIKKVFTEQAAPGTFRLTFTSVADFLLYEIKFKDGKPASMGVADQRAKAAAPGQGRGEQVEQCYDVFWVEFYPDGSTVWSYMYSYCNDACNTSRQVAGRGAIIACGGNSGEAVEYELIQNKTMRWEVYRENAGPPDFYFLVKASVILRGVKKSTEPGGGHFTNAWQPEIWEEHFDDYGLILQKIANQAWVGPQHAYHMVQVNIIHPPDTVPPDYKDKTESWEYAFVF
ncbi:MAG: hypothetical protein U0U70_05530 [Chitinophagaceae bacterium]